MYAAVGSVGASGYFLVISDHTPRVGVGSVSSSWSSFPLLASSPTSSILGEELSLFLPTLEALARATRLIGTAAVMAADYRFDRALRRAYSFGMMSAAAAAGKDESDVNMKRRAVEERIQRLEHDLDEAQRKYAESKPRQEGINPNSSDPQALTERVLAKRKDKEVMMIIADTLADAKKELASLVVANAKEDGWGDVTRKEDSIHARRLVDLCRTNGGCTSRLDSTSQISTCSYPRSTCRRSHRCLKMHQSHRTRTYVPW